jgi:ankyrin repeat protein
MGADLHADDDNALRWASQNGAHLHAEDDYALQWASQNGHLAVVELLLEHGADLHAHSDGQVRTRILQ